LALTLPADTSSPTFISEMFSQIDARIATGDRFSVIIDSSQVSRVTLKHTKEVVGWMRANREKLRNFLTCSSVVVVNPLVETALNMVFKLQKPVAPMYVVSDVGEAWDFIQAH
jgi:hypothetical protein